MYPPVLQSGLWLIIIVLFLFNQHLFVPVSSDVFLVIILGTLAFMLGGFSSTLKLMKPRSVPEVNRLPNLQIVNWVFWLTLIILPAFVLSVSVFKDVGPFKNLFQNLRYYRGGEESAATPFVMYFVTISYVSLGLQIISGFKTGKKAKLMDLDIRLFGLFGILFRKVVPVLLCAHHIRDLSGCEKAARQ